MEAHEAFSYLSERFDRVEVLQDPPVSRVAIASWRLGALHVAFRQRG